MTKRPRPTKVCDRPVTDALEPLDLEAYDYHLPPDRIADRPSPVRHESRLLVLNRDTGQREHHRFDAIADLVGERDLLVFNDSRVLPARLRTRKAETGGRVELLFVEPAGQSDRWRALARPAKGLAPGLALALEAAPDVVLRVVDAPGEGFVTVQTPQDGEQLCRDYGEMPLPPYIRRVADELDRERYQTVYARKDRAGSVAAPTAGLHFSEEVFARLDARGVERATLTLDVGPGTFVPIKTSSLADHRMHFERFELRPETVEAIERCRARGGRVIAVGTTTVRALESLPELEPGPKSTDLFIRPGHRFRWVDQLITNFHLPKSTLVVLVSALAGREPILEAYREAVDRGYRFYSYGDAMWIR